MMQTSDGYLWKLVLLLSDDPAVVKAVLLELRDLHAAFESAQKQPFSPLRGFLKRSTVTQPFMRWVLLFLAHVDFKTVPAQVLTMVGSVFNGYGQSRIVEAAP